MPFTNFADQAIMTTLGTGAALGNPSTWYFGLSTTTPSQVKGSGVLWTFTEPTSGTGGYARASLAANGTNWGAIGSEPSSGYTIQNLVAATFTTSTAAWSSGATALTYVGLWDNATVGSGNLWAFGLLTPSVTVNASGIPVSFPIDSVQWTND